MGNSQLPEFSISAAPPPPPPPPTHTPPSPFSLLPFPFLPPFDRQLQLQRPSKHPALNHKRSALAATAINDRRKARAGCSNVSFSRRQWRDRRPPVRTARRGIRRVGVEDCVHDVHEITSPRSVTQTGSES